MRNGMLWLDVHKKRTIEEKVQRAVDYFREKYKEAPHACYVNNQTVTDEFSVGKVRVFPVKNMAPHHILVSPETMA